MLDSTTDTAMPERICADAPDGLEFRKLRRRIMRRTCEAPTNVRSGRLANPGLFDFAGPVIGAASPRTGPENP